MGKEIKIGLTVVGVLLAVFLYVLFSRLAGRPSTASMVAKAGDSTAPKSAPSPSQPATASQQPATLLATRGSRHPGSSDLNADANAEPTDAWRRSQSSAPADQGMSLDQSSPTGSAPEFTPSDQPAMNPTVSNDPAAAMSSSSLEPAAPPSPGLEVSASAPRRDSLSAENETAPGERQADHAADTEMSSTGQSPPASDPFHPAATRPTRYAPLDDPQPGSPDSLAPTPLVESQSPGDETFPDAADSTTQTDAAPPVSSDPGGRYGSLSSTPYNLPEDGYRPHALRQPDALPPSADALSPPSPNGPYAGNEPRSREHATSRRPTRYGSQPTSETYSTALQPPSAGQPRSLDAGPGRNALPLADQFEHRGGHYTVQTGDNYWTIAKQVYGDGGYFKALYEHNRRQHPRADLLRAGDVIETPPASVLSETYPKLYPKSAAVQPAARRQTTSPGPRSTAGDQAYVVEEGDTLFDIARFELGKASRWVEIYELNRSTIGESVDYLRPGTRLRLPSKERAASITRGIPPTKRR